MKKTLSIIAMLCCIHAAGQVQFGGVIRGKNNAGTIDEIKRNADALKVSDSIAAAKLDSTFLSRKQVQVSNFPAVQTVAGTLTINPDSTKERIYHKVDVLNFPVTQPVSGTFWQATQPVSGTFWQATQPVSGTFWQATQPVSGTVGINNFPATQPVSGTFWQATQPVSGTITANAGTNLNTSLLALETGGNLASVKTNTDNLNLSQASTTSGQKGNLIMGAVTTGAPTYTTAQSNPLSLTTGGLLRIDGSGVTQPVSGTFWQATQPVSGTFWQATQPVSGTFWQATQPVSGTVTANAGSGTFNIQSNASVNVAQMNGVTTTMGNGIAGTGVQRVAIASDNTAFSVNAAQSGTWTVQPGNTANTTAWKVDGSAVTQPVSGTFWQATQPVSGTVTANAGTNLNTSLLALETGGNLASVKTNTDNLNLAQASTTSGQKGNLIMGAVTTGAPTYSTAQSNPLSLTTGGLLRVDGSAVTQPVSGTFWQATQPVSGTVTANQGGTWTVQPGNTANTTAWKVDGSAVTQPVSGTVSANASQTGTWTVQPGNTANTTAWKVDGSAVTQPVSGTVTANAGTNLNTSLLALETGGNLASVKTNTDNLNLAQASTTSGQKGNLIMGAVTTGAPTYTTAQSNPLSLTTGGLLRTDGSGVTQPVSGTVSANASQTGTWTVQPGNTANTTAWKVDGSAVTQPVSGTVTANQGGTWTVQPGNTANTTAWKVDGSAVTQPVSGTVSANASQTGTWTVQPGNTANTTAWKVDGSAVTQPVNYTQINGVTVNTGTGVQGTGVQRVTLASDQTAISTAGVFSVKIDQTTPGTTNAVAETHLPATAASADAFANPTITQMGSDNMVYNGSTWDRQRGMGVSNTTGDAGAKTATGNGATQTNVGNKGLQIFIVLGTVSGTTPTCVFKVQGSVDGGTNWYDVPAAATASLTASTNVGIMLYPGITVLAGTTTTGTTATCSEVLPRTWRMVWTIGGTTPSFTITSITYNYLPN